LGHEGKLQEIIKMDLREADCLLGGSGLGSEGWFLWLWWWTL